VLSEVLLQRSGALRGTAKCAPSGLTARRSCPLEGHQHEALARFRDRQSRSRRESVLLPQRTRNHNLSLGRNSCRRHFIILPCAVRRAPALALIECDVVRSVTAARACRRAPRLRLQNGRERLLAFQLRGPSRSGQSPKGWRLLDTGKIESLAVLDEAFAGSRGESHRGHLRRDRDRLIASFVATTTSCIINLRLRSDANSRVQRRLTSQ